MPSPTAGRRRLFHGAFGAGQSQLARDAVCEAANAGVRDILYIVANRNAAASVRSELVRRQGAVFGLHVVTMRGLSSEIERRARIRGAPVASGIIDEVRAEQAVRTTVQKGDWIGDPLAIAGLASAAARTIAEVEQGGATRTVFDVALNGMPRVDEGASILLGVWNELERLRRPDARCAADVQRSAIELLRVRGAGLVTPDSFVVLEDIALTRRLDRELVSALVECAPCPVVATSEYAQQLLLAPATHSYQILRSLAAWEERACSRNIDWLAGAEHRIFGPEPDLHEFRRPGLGVIRLQAAGETREVRLAARVVKRELRKATGDNPMHASDILVVARGSRYRNLICEIFTECGIGTNTAPRRSAAETGLGSVLLSVLRLAADASGGTREDALALLRAPHLDISTRAVDRLARRVITRGYLGIDSWDERAFRGLGERIRNRVHRLRRSLAIARASFVTASSHQEMTRTVRRLGKELRIVGNAYFARARIAAGAGSGEHARRLMNSAVREDNETWEIVQRILDDVMPSLLEADISATSSNEPAFPSRWLSLFARAVKAEDWQRHFEGKDLVRVAGTAKGDGQPARVTIVLGLRQRQFPRQPRQDPFLRDGLREKLRDFGIEMSTSEDTADSEREAFIRAISTASDALYLSYSATDADGDPMVASFFIDDFQRAVGKHHQFPVERLGIPDVVPEPEDAIRESELLAAVANGIWQRLPASRDTEESRAASFTAWNDLLANAATVAPVSARREAATRPSFNREQMAQAPHTTLELSASQLKLIQHCTFQHFVQAILRPGALVAPEYDALAKGSLIHEAMATWVKLDGWQRGDEALPELDRWFTRRAARLPSAAPENPLARFKIDQDRDRLNGFVRDELRAISSARAAQPAFNELGFGERIAHRGDHDSASVAASLDIDVATSLGVRTVRFNGSVDRVDTYEADGVTYGIALDYKTGESSKSYADAMTKGIDLQLRIYLLALEQLWGIKPAGALYVGFGDGIRHGVISETAVDRIGVFDPKCVSVKSDWEWDDFVHAGTQRLIVPLIERLVTFDITARPYKGDCGFCELVSICRYNSYQPIGPDA